MSTDTLKCTPRGLVSTDDEKHKSASGVRHFDNENRTDQPLWRRQRFEQLVARLTSNKSRVEVFSRTWKGWFPCVVRPHSNATRTVAVVYHNGTDTVVKLLDPESPMIRIVKGPLYSICSQSIKTMYSHLYAQIKCSLKFYEVKTGETVSEKKVHSCFSGRDLVLWLRSAYLGANVMQEDGVMAQLGSELLTRGIIYRIKLPFARGDKGSSSEKLKSQENMDTGIIAPEDTDGESSFSQSPEYVYALNEGSTVIEDLIEMEKVVIKEQEDRLWWTTKSHLEVFTRSTSTWELAVVVATFGPWLLLVYCQEAQAARGKWIHRLDVNIVRHPRRFWRAGTQTWVFSRGDNEWYAGFVTSRETRDYGETHVPWEENIVNVRYGLTDSDGAFTMTKSVKLDSEHIRPRVSRISRMCIKVSSINGEPLQKLEWIKHRLAIYSEYASGEKPFRDAQPDIHSLILVCRNVKMTISQRDNESKHLSEALKCEVTIDVLPWELFTAGRDVLYNIQRPTTNL